MPPSADRVGPYILEEHLDSGAQGRVFRATHRKTRQRVALKVVAAPGSDSEADKVRRRVIRELEYVQPLRHPGIVRIFDAGQVQRKSFFADTWLYVAYEMIEGGTLRDRFRKREGLTFEDIAHLAVRLGAALGFLHSRGLLHKDVKPENVMLREGNCRAPVLVDFGYLGNLRPGASVSSVAHGSYGYMAPETVVRPDAASAASDQWSLARCLLEASVICLEPGLHSLAHESADALLAFIEARCPVLAAAVARALAPEPTARFPRVHEFAAAFCQGLIEDRLTTEDAVAAALSGLMTAGGLVPLCRALSDLLGEPMVPHAFTNREVIIVPARAKFWACAQLTVRRKGNQWYAMIAFRSQQALDTAEVEFERLANWQLLAANPAAYGGRDHRPHSHVVAQVHSGHALSVHDDLNKVMAESTFSAEMRVGLQSGMLSYWYQSVAGMGRWVTIGKTSPLTLAETQALISGEIAPIRELVEFARPFIASHRRPWKRRHPRVISDQQVLKLLEKQAERMRSQVAGANHG